jgi:hypothetical protein
MQVLACSACSARGIEPHAQDAREWLHSPDFNEKENAAMSRDLQADIANVFSRVELNRRDMVVSSLAAGFALAVQPISAATITTSSEGLTAGEVKIPVGDDAIPGYRAMPSKGGPFPVVLVVQEIFGGGARVVLPAGRCLQAQDHR